MFSHCRHGRRDRPPLTTTSRQGIILKKHLFAILFFQELGGCSQTALFPHFTPKFMEYAGTELKPAPLLQSLDAICVLPTYAIPGHHQALQNEHLAVKSTVPSVCMCGAWGLYEWCGECRFKYRFMDNLQSIARCLSNFSFQGQLPVLAMHPAHGRRINAAQLDSPGCFHQQSYKIVILSPFTSLFFKQNTIRFSNFLIFIGV